MRKPTASSARSFRARLLAWYARHGRSFPWRQAGAPVYEQAIAELLLQRTRANAVARHLPLVLELVPSWDALASISEERLGDALRPLGLWKQRAAALKRLATEIAKRGGELPQTLQELEKLPAIGQYMANAFVVILGAGRAPYVDANMARVLERHFGPRRLADIRYDPALQEVACRIVNSPRCQLVNWAILDLAALVCTLTRPRCAACPLKRTCVYSKKLIRGPVKARSAGLKRAYTSSTETRRTLTSASHAVLRTPAPGVPR